MKSKGTIFIFINNHKTTTSQFLYNLAREEKEDVFEHLEEKCEEFFHWYISLENKEKISTVEVISPDFACENKCILPPGAKFSVIGIMINKKQFLSLLVKLTKKHGLRLNIESIE
jgi:hypothetical protein